MIASSLVSGFRDVNEAEPFLPLDDTASYREGALQ